MQDAIEDRIDIDATAAAVWKLVSEPGWWINDGTYREHRIEERDGMVIVTDPEHGVFPLVIADSDEPRYIAFRWLERDGVARADGPGTLTEFWLDERPGGVTLRVRESGFASLGKPEADLLAHLADNTSGWRQELDVARRHIEANA
ncbi:SRPBCC domain-containing protein [Flexivirga meconopsidis]|uniref:SRPBCC domain-containing protein n=1 Tax=Flexivirga meconopsidis TaxID=2977121 RepID=UPI0022402D2F|nr:SRPBCC domain-containing protein [Flexivirga meconopsidis]